MASVETKKRQYDGKIMEWHWVADPDLTPAAIKAMVTARVWIPGRWVLVDVRDPVPRPAPRPTPRQAPRR